MAKAQTETTETVADSKSKVTTVTLTDGRVVDFPGKRKILKETVEDGGKVFVRMDFVNGETRTFEAPTSLTAKLVGHGLSQKLGDETAGLKDVDDAVIAVDALYERLAKGEWSVTRASGGMAGASVLVKALIEHTGKSAEQIKAFLANKSQAEKIALRNNPKIKPIVDRIESEKAKKAGATVDTDALLGELDAPEETEAA